jgi:FKBP-type peptidyl-prolyl cis-trans isomerase FkpA
MMRRFVLAIPVLLVSVACGGDDGTPTSPTPPAPSPSPSVGLDVPFSTEDLIVGTGQEAMNDDTLSVGYTGWLYDPNAAENKGMEFDSRPATNPFQFVLGAGRVIAGWDQGVLGMRVGGLRRLVIPPELGYGDAGQGPIPGDATLLFEVDLVGID